MQILSVDIGTGTQDILLYDPRLDVENGFKLIMPSPTMIVHRKIKKATRQGSNIVLTGVTMGGGPSHWAVENHIKAGLKVYATPDAARSFNDDLDLIKIMGIHVIGEDEVGGFEQNAKIIQLMDFDFDAIYQAFQGFGVTLNNLIALGIAVFDHGAAPPNYSDRKFRFEYLERRILDKNSLSGFAFRDGDIPEIMTRLQAVANSARKVNAPLVFMDTAPAAVLGATLDPKVNVRKNMLISNVGNFHTLAFRLGKGRIEGVFEHHTGLLNQKKLDELILTFAEGTLTDDFVFEDHGHGARLFTEQPYDLDAGDFAVAVTGPRRSMLSDSIHKTYFPAPYGDMMLLGCFGMLVAMADLLPDNKDMILNSLVGGGEASLAPWDVE